MKKIGNILRNVSDKTKKLLKPTGQNCSTPNDCCSSEICKNGKCITPICSTDGECHYGQTCQNGLCVAKSCKQNSNQTCSKDEKCVGGKCVLPPCTDDGKHCQCKTDTECSTEKICNIDPCSCLVGQCTKPIQSKLDLPVA